MAESIALPQVAAEQPWWKELTLYHWLVVILGACGWLFDCMCQRIFTLCREPALSEVLGSGVADTVVKNWGGWATTATMIGWATGGIIFGMTSDRWGRVKTMVITLLVYTGFTGLSGLSRSPTEFLICRYLCGLGVGGMFGAATTLVAESVPGRFRAIALGLLQTLSAAGNIIGSLLTTRIRPGEADFLFGQAGWRIMFFVGFLPALLAIPFLLVLREPQRWKEARRRAAADRDPATPAGSVSDLLWRIVFYIELLVFPLLILLRVAEGRDPSLRVGSVPEPLWGIPFFLGVWVVPSVLVLRGLYRWKKAPRPAADRTTPSTRVGSIPDLVRHPRWRRNLFVGVCLGLAGMAGLWGIGFFSPELISTALQGQPQRVIDIVRGYGTALQDVGSFFGMLTFTIVATALGRRWAFAGAFTLCLAVTIFVFNNLRSGTDAYWMLPMMGFAQLSLFGGYSIYFPELFPTRLRGTGVSFCYNTVRYLAAGFPPMLMFLNRQLTDASFQEPFRTAATMLSFIFVLGLVALIWAPETKGQPLPED